jgi:hypothetical protein
MKNFMKVDDTSRCRTIKIEANRRKSLPTPMGNPRDVMYV